MNSFHKTCSVIESTTQYACQDADTDAAPCAAIASIRRSGRAFSPGVTVHTGSRSKTGYQTLHMARAVIRGCLNRRRKRPEFLRPYYDVRFGLWFLTHHEDFTSLAGERQEVSGSCRDFRHSPEHRLFAKRHRAGIKTLRRAVAL